MRRLLVSWLLFGGLLLAGATQAQHRPNQGQALVARPSGARYQRLPVARYYYRLSRRARYHYAPSYHAYHNRSPYQTHIYSHRRPSGRSPVAALRPRMAGH